MDFVYKRYFSGITNLSLNCNLNENGKIVIFQKRRAIANVIAKFISNKRCTYMNDIAAYEYVYAASSEVLSTHLGHKTEKESHRNLYCNILSKYYTCYTKHIQSIFEKSNLVTNKHVLIRSCMLLVLEMKKREPSQTLQQNL